MGEEFLKATIDKFNKKASEDPNMIKDFGDMKRKVQVQITDGDTFSFLFENGRIDGFRKGPIDAPDITISASAETLNQLSSGELRVMKAYAMKKVQVKGSLQDLLKLRKFF
ncbi:MAG TPA: SCP2 sterol-binding domain-containing protein [Thermoplasmata archaeon]